jgi:hypothetical protein
MVERSDKRAREWERRSAINATSSGLQKEDERSEYS